MSMQTAGDAFIALDATHVVVCGLALLGGIYLLFGGITWLLTQHILPAASLWGNCIGHCNYGFQFGFMDRLFGTQLDENAAQPQLQRYLKRHSSSVE